MCNLPKIVYNTQTYTILRNEEKITFRSGCSCMAISFRIEFRTSHDFRYAKTTLRAADIFRSLPKTPRSTAIFGSLSTHSQSKRLYERVTRVRWVMGYAAALCLLVLIISQSIIIPTFFMPFFRWQYARLDVAETIQVSDEELMRVTESLLDYMRGRRDTLEDIYAVVAGEERRFFSDIEIRHMIDVRVLYDRLFIVRNVAFFMMVGIVLGLALMRHRLLYVLARCVREIMAGFLILSLIMIGIIAIDWYRAFEVFHLIFFDNDYWILDPRVDLLINMVPYAFFIHISIFIAVIMGGVPVTIIVASTLYLSHMHKPSFGRL